MQRTLNEFLAGVLQGRYNAEVVQSRDNTIRKHATYKDLC